MGHWQDHRKIIIIIQVREDGDVEHLITAAPGETLMEVVKYEPVSAGPSTFEKTSKIVFINPSTLRHVLSTEPGRRTCKCNAVDQRDCRHTAREAGPLPFPQAASARPTRTSARNTQDKHVLSSAAKTEIMCLIATADTSANTVAMRYAPWSVEARGAKEKTKRDVPTFFFG
jgi:hypothetical protein